MKDIFYRLGLKTKINRKKKPAFLSISPNRTFYITFGLSVIFHVGLMYTIPAVNLFSEGLEGPVSKAIIVDLFQEESLAVVATIPTDENQFQTDIPTFQEEEIAAESEPEPMDIEVDSLPPEKITDLENDYTLLPETVTREFESNTPVLKRQFSQELPAHIPENNRQQSEKPLAEPTQPDLRFTQLRIEKNELIKISPLSEKTQPQQKESDMALRFPTSVQKLKDSQPEIRRTVLKKQLPQKQFSQNLPTHIPERRPQQPGKVPVKQIQPDLRLTQAWSEINEPVKINPLNTKVQPQQKESEMTLRFPTSAPTPKDVQRDESEEFPNTHFGAGKRQLSDLKKTTPPILSMVELSASSTQKRQFGITKERKTDKNQFGIFAGKKFEVPTLKENVQRTVPAEKAAQQVSDATQTAETLQTESQIEGPIKGRGLLRRPQPPQIDNIGIDVKLKLKFWVLPDGTIGEVIPIKRGNAELEQIAIAYLKKWQFEPLAEGAPQQQIWGTIPIKFTMR